MARVTLTFDNGPEPPVTHDVLDTLARHRIKTTFFVIGEKLETPDGRAAVERAQDEGHWVANHSYTHARSLGDMESPTAFDDEVTRTQNLLGDLAHPDRLFRPFCNAGQIDERVFKRAHIEQLERGGYTCVMFDAVVHDWEDAEGWVDRALNALRERPWTTLILHDVVGYPPGNVVNGMQHLDRFLGLLDSDGHEIVQELDPHSMPIVKGKCVGDVERLCN
ncbi:MAG: polysaccharide deacetylase family protein [Gaiellaceae bacterium]